MPVDLLTEHVISLGDVTKLPCIPRRRGRQGRLHTSTVWRWATKGLGGIKLEVVRAGGTLCTSPQAIQRFFERLAGVRAAEPPKAAATGNDAAEVERRLDSLGVRAGQAGGTHPNEGE